MTGPARDDSAVRAQQGPRAYPRSDWPEEKLGKSRTLSVGEFAIFALRVTLGLSMLQVAYKLSRIGWEGWVNAHGLLPEVVSGPLGSIYANFWGEAWVLVLVILGSGAVGIGLVLGFLTRLSALVGTFMMLSFYTADLPPSTGWFEVQLVQIFAFFAVSALGAGHIWGIDALIRRMELKSRWWWIVLG